MADAHGALRSALTGLFHPATAEVRSSSQRRWSSLTFSGARHRYAFRVSGERAGAAVDGATAAIGREDFALDGHVVADIAIVGRRSRSPALVEIELEALTVEAA